MGLFGRRPLLPQDVSVLIVDDEAPVRMVARTYLEEFGFTDIREAGSGEEALNLTHRYTPDLIVLDFMMPKMDGEAVAKHIRKMAPGAAIIVFSGVLRFNPAWADDYVDKLAVKELPQVCFDFVRVRHELGAAAAS
jgi:CheY-like chemotaxis protein